MLRFISISQSFKSEVKRCGKYETLFANETAESGSKKVILHRRDAKAIRLRRSIMQEPVL